MAASNGSEFFEIEMEQHADAFPRPSNAEALVEDEEELLWAALERLPSQKRANFAIMRRNLSKISGPTQRETFDVRKLDRIGREQLVKNAMVTSDQDNFLLLSGVKERLDRVGMKVPTVEVRFEGLTVSANVLVGKRALPTLVNFCRNGIEMLLTSLKIFHPQRHSLTILNNISGSIKPGRMTLLLGPPSSGKTTLLLALAGKLGPDLKKSGKVTYNGHTFDEFFIQRTSAYTSQTDNHMAELTVRETLDFGARFQGASYGFGGFLHELTILEMKRNIRPNPEIDAFMKASSIGGKKHSLMTDYVLRVLGLDVCADTFVGNEMLRGVSGGQKKRVTTGEMIVGPRKTIFMDEISTGLDSSTTFQIVKSIRNFVHQMEGTVLMALLQPAPETFDLFDDLILLSEGHVVYQGPRSRVIDFFKSLGFSCPPRKGVADFLQEVTSKKDQAQYWSEQSKPYVFVPVPEIAAAFRSSEYGKSLEFGLSVPYDKKESLPSALADTEYAVGKMELFKACFSRELVLIRRHRFIYIFRTFQVAFVGIVTCTMFLRTRLHPTDEVNGNLYLSCLFFGLVHMLFNGFSELPIMITRLPVFFKQRDNSFHPAWAYCIPSWILRLPYSVLESVVWSCVVYYTVGFAPHVGRFFRFMLLLFSTHQMAVGLFRTLAVLARDTTIANICASGTLLVCFLLGGFMVPKDMIKPWWIWGFWVSPLSYGQRALSVNEFGATRWMKKSAYGNNSIGYNVLHSHGLPTSDKWYWIGVAVLLGYSVLFNILVTLGLAYLHPLTKSRAIEFAEDEENNDESERSPTAKSNHTSKKGMILPFQPLSMTFHNLNYFVDMPEAMKQSGVPEKKLQLLSNVSGVFLPGSLTALVGSSGAGKTTLMDVLAGRKTGGYIEGDIRISGYPKQQKTFTRISGYVEQSDIHSPQITVGESLWFSASLRLPRELDNAKKREFVEEVMALVELETLRDSLVGLPGTSGLSTEQRKRLTIAVELVANPSIIFMDEPTSGLDARAAAIVMRTVRNTVDTGRTVVCTIHQPSINIFEAFDELLLMKRGGRVIYGGKLGVNSNIMIDYFQRIDGVPPIPEGYNPATWMLEVTTQACEDRIGEDFATIYKNSDQYREVEELIQRMSVPDTGSEPIHFNTQFPQNSLNQFKSCLWKQNLVYWRTPQYNVVKLLLSILSGLILGSVFWGVGSKRNSTQGLLTAMGAIYASCMFLGVNNSQSIQPVISVERAVFYRERAAGLYSAFPYAAAQGLIEVPYILAQTIIYGFLTYFMMDFERTIGKFLLYLVFMFLTFAYFTCYGMMAVGLTPNQQLAAIFSSAFYSLWNLMSGFLIPKPRMPVWWVWFHYIDPVAWTLRGVISSQFGDVESTIVGAGFEGSVGEYVKFTLGYTEKGLIGISVVVLMIFVFLFFATYATAIKVLNFQKR